MERMKNSRKSSIKGRNKFNQTSLIRNKDYKCINQDESVGIIFTERNSKSRPCSPKSTITKKKIYEPLSDIKTIEIDVANEISPPWFNLKVIEGTYATSKTLLKEAMKNYFVFLEFFKKIENFSQQNHAGDISELLAKNEKLFFKELQSVKELNMDIDGIQKQIQEFDFILEGMNDISVPQVAKIQHEWNSNTNSVPCLGINWQTADDNQILKNQIDNYEQKVAKLELDLKREKELRHVKYYRTDKKTTEIKKLCNEKDELINRCMKYEWILKEFERRNRLVLLENQELSAKLQSKSNECQELNKDPPMNKEDYQIRIKELESEIGELKLLITSFETSFKSKSNPGDTKELLEKLSVMLLNKNVDSSFFSEKQKELIRSLFGDYATTTYKNKINELNDKIEKYEANKNYAKSDASKLLEKNLHYVNWLSKILPSKDSLIDEKIYLAERLADWEKWLSKSETQNMKMSTMGESSQTKTARLKRDYFANINIENGGSFNLLDNEDSINFDIFDKETDKNSPNNGKENLYWGFE